MNKQNDFVECEFYLINETDGAFLVSSDEEQDDKQWIPKAMCQYDPDDLPATGEGNFTMMVREPILIEKRFL